MKVPLQGSKYISLYYIIKGSVINILYQHIFVKFLEIESIELEITDH